MNVTYIWQYRLSRRRLAPRDSMKRTTRIVVTAILVVGLLAGGVGGVQATHDNPNWGDNPGESDQEDCSVGHINPHDDGEKRPAADDCGIDRGDA